MSRLSSKLLPVFDLDSSNHIILVETLFKGPKDERLVKLVLDTGASITSISFQTAMQIGLDPAASPKRIEIATASGIEFVPTIIIPKLTFLGCSVSNIHAICLNLPRTNSEADGLLGLDVLKNFDLFLKFRSRTLEIR